jgi:hypothetical protein
MTELVECHSGYAYAEKPVAINWQGKRLVIGIILGQVRTPEGPRFHVRTEDGQEFILFFHEARDEWQITQLQET